ncbi:hypothetical protein GGD50_002913 [Rhizobium paranaense]|uniref:Uncharacterized protein n=1 Tax=Rhizobium paranaense TaxID=1650438 RepID=A0A7W8XRQ2_9HYPH|nr:hypothetical protein [Rhizobium paranaense]
MGTGFQSGLAFHGIAFPLCPFVLRIPDGNRFALFLEVL